MVKHEGNLDGSGLKIAVVISRFNSFVTDRLLSGAIDGLVRHGVAEKDIDVFYCPGAFEIPAIAGKVVGSKKHNALICLGAVIRGETPHFDYIASESAKGIGQLGLNSNVPVIYSVLTTDTVDQAVDRAGGKSGNKGFDAAISAIEMANLLKQL